MIMIFHSQIAITLPGILSHINKHLNYGVDIFLLLSGMCLYFSFSILDFIYNASGLSLGLTKYENYLILGEPLIWYVAFIMAMYLLYPFIYKILHTDILKNKTAVIITMLISAVAVTLFIKIYSPETYTNTEVFMTRIPVFLTGCYLGKAVKEKQKFRLCDYILFLMFIPAKLLIASVLKTTDIIFHRYLGFFGAFTICFAVVILLEAIRNIKFIIAPVKKFLGFFGGLSLEIYIIHVLLYNALLYYIPDLKASSAFTYREKALMYLGILVVSVIIGFIFNKAYNAILSKKKAVTK